MAGRSWIFGSPARRPLFARTRRQGKPSFQRTSPSRAGVKCRSAVIKSAVFEPNWHPKVGCVYDLSVRKVPSAPSSFSLNSLEPSPAVWKCRQKKARRTVSRWGSNGDVPSAFPFCARRPGVDGAAFSLKQSPCPHCGCIGSLNRHSRALVNDPKATDGETFRGQRVYCSKRGQRGGCGRTFAFFLADILPRHTVTASLVWPWLVKLLAGFSLKAAAEKLRLPFALETIFRLRRGLHRRLDALRTRLCREQSPPASTHPDPLRQTVEHLQTVFAGSPCPPADFQLRFQQP